MQADVVRCPSQLDCAAIWLQLSACSIYVKVCWLLFPAQIARLLLGKAGNQLSQRFHLDSCYSWQDFTMSGEGPTDIKC